MCKNRDCNPAFTVHAVGYVSVHVFWAEMKFTLCCVTQARNQLPTPQNFPSPWKNVLDIVKTVGQILKHLGPSQKALLHLVSKPGYGSAVTTTVARKSSIRGSYVCTGGLTF